MSDEERIAAADVHAHITETALNLSDGAFKDYLTELAVELRERFDFPVQMDGWVTL